MLAAGAVAALATAVLVSRNARQAERRHPPLGCFIRVDGVGLHVVEMGKGEQTLVFIHGNGSMIPEMLASGVPHRLAERRRIIIFDRPGLGYSERPRSRVWTLSAQARLIAKALRLMEAKRPIAVGHSLGGLVALKLALEEPVLIEGLGLLAGYYYRTPRPAITAATPLAVPLLGDAADYTILPLVGRPVVREMIRKSFEPNPVTPSFRHAFSVDLALRPWHIRAAAEDTAFLNPGAARAQPRYRNIRLPSMILSGTEDRIIDAHRHSVRLARELPEAELQLLPGVGHMLHHVAPDEVCRALERLARRARGAG